jgi:hypothetical protein
LRLVFEREGVVNNTSTTLASDTQPDQYSHSRQVPFNEIRGTI